MNTPKPSPWVKRAAFLLTMISPLALLISSQIAVFSDRNADLVSHTQCEVFDAHKSSKKYQIETSCGSFEVGSNNYSTIQEGNTYDLETTPGNWARKARIMQATPSTETSY